MLIRVSRRMLGGAGVGVCFIQLGTAAAQVQTDGSLGPVVSISGKMVIDDTLGTQAGANLFHSFSLFNVRSGESATFTSAFSGVTRNVFARVTGPGLSWIDGSLGCSIPGADLWLFNPNGIAFGKNASLNVSGSFRASTADYIAFEGGGRFSADGHSPALLSVANPEAFGFIRSNPAAIAVTGSNLKVPNGKSLALVGGSLDVTGGTLEARGGRIDLVAAASAGEARISSTGGMDISSFSALGSVSLTGKSTVTLSESLRSGGAIYIRGGRFYIDDSRIQNNTGDEDSGPIDVEVSGDIAVANRARIRTDTFYLGRSGDIRLAAGGDVTISENSWVSATTYGGDGDSGSVAVSGRNVSLSDGGRIYTSTDGGAFGNAGNVTVKAVDTVSISGLPQNYSTGVASNSSLSYGAAGRITVEAARLDMNGGAINTENILAAGGAGDIAVRVASLSMQQGALMSTGSRGVGAGGILDIAATTGMSLAGNSFVQSTASSGLLGSGPGGRVSIATPKLAIDGSTIATYTYGAGAAGDIDLSVGTLELTSGNILSAALNSASAYSSGAAGEVSITAAGDVVLKNSGSALDAPWISSSTFGNGNAGSVRITAPRLIVDDGSIDTNTFMANGNAGTVTIDVKDLVLRNGGSISSVVGATATGKGGAIEVVARDSLSIAGSSPTSEGLRSSISAGTLGAGNGGSIAVRTPKLELDGGAITASTAGRGNAGSIALSVGTLSLRKGGNVQVASLGAGSGGWIQVSADRIDIDGADQGAGGTGISSEASGTGAGGDISLSADQITLKSGALITARSTGTGKAGSLSLNARDSFRLSDSSVLTSSELAAGGNIAVSAGSTLEMQNSTISSSANGVTPTDDGGNVSVENPQFLILNLSTILARANAGNGGNISLAADYFVSSADSTISASSKQGLDGKIVIDSPNQVTGRFATLELPPLKVSEILRDRCAAAALRGRSSFVVEGSAGLQCRPGDFVTSPLRLGVPGGRGSPDAALPVTNRHSDDRRRFR